MSKLNSLILCVSNLSQKDQVFAKSLIDQSTTRQLSPKQEYWVGVLADKASTKPETVPVGIDISSIIELIRCNNNAKRPKIRFLSSAGELVLTVASSKASVSGSINVVCDKVWYGRIRENGQYEPSRKINEESQKSVIADLLEIAKDPTKAAAEYGKKTGHCCFCALKLDDPRSLTVGYGPICAKKYKLQWNITDFDALFVKKITNEQAFY